MKRRRCFLAKASPLSLILICNPHLLSLPYHLEQKPLEGRGRIGGEIEGRDGRGVAVTHGHL
jgi:hypothetical protein